ncbi:MAG: translation elongation factor Ts [Bacteroidales bacterium]|nr:translation elongation factor Ts [Bacteroidales bacterium]MDD2204706.1 translation elongation factor Ts [Bacteroidales bacterium]MDD3151945.1 translation elongation factor Ts [Bacteroidales bacterium]MDD3914065.1 translation elongation factor Ts [Bacteroidales bacterium]MDD4634033.1 translation elongation factor Ts [Bacteroidales bacterium]
MNITASEVNNLRQMTGAGMMDCKKALVEAEGNVEKAIEILRKKGQKVASNRADRDAKEGKVVAKVSEDGTFACMIMLNCETDFVAKSADFTDFANAIVDVAVKGKIKTMEELQQQTYNGRTIEQSVMDLTGKTGEKMTLAHYVCLEAPKVFAYNHIGNRLATILAMNKNGEKIETAGHEIAMQIAAMAPVAVDEAGVPQDIIDKELEIAKDVIRKEGKSENMVEKIAMGKLSKFFKENTLLDQVFVRDGKITVAEYLKQTDPTLKVLGFKRLILGE